MSRSLSRSAAFALGLVVMLGLGVSGYVLYQVAAREGIWGDSYPLRVAFPDANSIRVGTPVTVRGVDAGRVVAVEYPAADEPDSEPLVWVRVELDERFRGRVYADATVASQSTGLLGSGVVAIDPGSPGAGPLVGDTLRGTPTLDVAAVSGKLAAVADQADSLLAELRASDGTIPKLLRDDQVYEDLKAVSSETRQLVLAVRDSVGQFRDKMDKMDRFVEVGQETVESVKQDADAIKSLPIIRGYVEDPTAVMMRPNARRERQVFETWSLFEPGTAVFTAQGREKVIHVANWLNLNKVSGSEVAVVSFADPSDASLTSAYAKTLTQKQCEAIRDLLQEQKAHKLGWISSRDIIARGFGFSPPPVVETREISASNVQILLFLPR